MSQIQFFSPSQCGGLHLPTKPVLLPLVLVFLTAVVRSGVGAEPGVAGAADRSKAVSAPASVPVYTGKSPFRALPARLPPAVPRGPMPGSTMPKPPTRKMAIAETCPSLVNLVKKAPASVTVGETFACEILVAAQCDVANVVVLDDLPEGATLVRSEPLATQSNGQLCWRWSALGRGDVKTLKVILRADRAGNLSGSATVSAIPRVSLSVNVTGPQGAKAKSEKAGQGGSLAPVGQKP